MVAFLIVMAPLSEVLILYFFFEITLIPKLNLGNEVAKRISNISDMGRLVFYSS